MPKFAFEREGSWHIHWPVDNPHVVHAASEKDLIVELAAWLLELGRVANRGKHVAPEYPGP